MRIAAFDLGSNSFHMIVVETRPDGSFTSVAKERVMLRLGDVVARDGALGKSARDDAFEVVRRFKMIADSQKVDQIVAVGTSAMREASDGSAFVEAVRRQLGVEIHIIDGIREATTIFAAIRASVVLDPSPALALDLGGGSLELMLGDASGLQFASSAKVGVGRLTTMFLHSDPPSENEIAKAKKYIGKELDSVLDELVEFRPQLLVGSSGTFIAIATIASALREGKIPDHINHLTVTYDDVVKASERVLSESRSARNKIIGADARRSELLPAGFLVLLYVMERLRLNALTISGWALREGLILQAIAEHDPTDLSDDPRSIRRSSVLSLCHRCNWRYDHATKVAALATSIFDATQQLHRLSDSDRELLEFGALLHDIGEHISRINHDRHSAYLIEHGGLRGFAPLDIKVLSLLTRFHQRGNPKQLEKNAHLPADELDSLRKLVGILRIADALDASHSEEVSEVRVSLPDSRSILFTLVVKNDAELELWSLHRKQSFFESVFGLTCLTEVERIPHKRLISLLPGGSGLG